MKQLTKKEKQQVRKTLENKIGRKFENGIYATTLREITFRDYDHDGSTGTVVQTVIEASSLDIKELSKAGIKIISADYKPTDGYKDCFSLHISGKSEVLE